MKLPLTSSKNSKSQSSRLAVSAVLFLFALGTACWVGSWDESPGRSKISGTFTEKMLAVKKGSVASGSGEVGEAHDRTASHEEIDGHRPAPQFRAQPKVASPVMAVLATGDLEAAERVRELQEMRGSSFSDAEREAALAFLAGKELPKGVGRGSVNWVSDELITALRLQEPPWDGLAAALADVAFQPETDPVIRDYIIQHLGHLWEQYGAREVVDQALWRAVESSDETTPGTALIVLSRGYERDAQEKSLVRVRQRALALAANPNTFLGVRVTALSIAGDGGGQEVKDLAEKLIEESDTPEIFKKVAERIAGQIE